ncbi:MAG: ATP-binding protein [Ignavibacteriaceae bacterium]|nr:ATP-binding protein [Ignavibacteriaceae bacterium]
MKKRIPSKTANYADLINENGYYVDKTRFIEILERMSDKYVFFLRPRRFGKSLFLSLLEHYYGVQHSDKFERLFSGYFIGQAGNTTPLKNSYYILRFDFSGIYTESEKDIMRLFNEKLFIGFREFNSNYRLLTDDQIREITEKNYPSEILGAFLSSLPVTGLNSRIYLLIDEYDHFTNELFSFNHEHFQEIVTRNGWVRKFYEVIKQFTGSGLIDRFFATGVTPVTLDSMTSGFNIARNITLDPDFNTMAGFTESELKALIMGTIYEEEKFDPDKLLTDMRAWFNGSRFSPEGGERLYNPQLVLSFLTVFESGYEYPREITDNNVTSDWKKISNILGRLPKKERDAIIEEVYVNESIEGSLSTQFNPETPYRPADAISVLFYNGLLTIDKEEYGIIRYVIPNYVIKNIYWEYLRIKYEHELDLTFDLTDKGRIFRQMAAEGKIDLLIEETSKIMTPLMSNDYQNFSESNLKMIVISLLSLNKMYIIHSELEVTGGRLDLLLTRYDPYDSKYQFLLEFKYLKMRDEKRKKKAVAGNEPDKYEQVKEEGIAQLKRYRESEYIKNLKDLRSYLIIFREKRKWEVIEI